MSINATLKNENTLLTVNQINREIRKSGIKKLKIAKEAKISYVYLSKILNGERKPKNLQDILQKIKLTLN